MYLRSLSEFYIFMTSHTILENSDIIICEHFPVKIRLCKYLSQLFNSSKFHVTNCEELRIFSISVNTKFPMTFLNEETKSIYENFDTKFVKNCSELAHCDFNFDFLDPFSNAAHFHENINTNFALNRHDEYMLENVCPKTFRIEQFGCCEILVHKNFKTSVVVYLIFLICADKKEVVRFRDIITEQFSK